MLAKVLGFIWRLSFSSYMFILGIRIRIRIRVGLTEDEAVWLKDSGSRIQGQGFKMNDQRLRIKYSE